MTKNKSIYFAMRALFILALLSTLGSMYFGYYGDPVTNYGLGEWFNINNALPICDLCRYIRICTYPLVVILGLALIKRDLHSLDYVMPLVIIGFIFSIYKYRLQMFAEIKETGICMLSQVPCSDIAVQYLGFITLPFMGIVTFLLMGIIILRINGKR